MAEIVDITYDQPEPPIEITMRGMRHTIPGRPNNYPSVSYRVNMTLQDTRDGVNKLLYETANYLPYLSVIHEQVIHDYGGVGYLDITYSLHNIYELREAKPHLFV